MPVEINNSYRLKPLLLLTAWFSLAVLLVAWLPALPLTSRVIWGYVGLIGLTVSLALTGSVIDSLRHMAVLDHLTGLGSYSLLQHQLRRDLAQARRRGEPLSLIFADLDYFKQLNDRYGHATGDQVLQAVARAIQRAVRNCDMVARYGGEEFVVVLPRTDHACATQVAERIRTTIESLKIPLANAVGASGVYVTTSLGIATFPEHGADGETLLQVADENLYHAKRSGRNQVGQPGQNLFRLSAGRRVTPPIPHATNLPESSTGSPLPDESGRSATGILNPSSHNPVAD